MASFSSWNGAKTHGNKSLLTDVLKLRMGFAGLVVGDWNGHGQVPGCTVTHCPQALMAGLDLYMASDSWRGLFDATLADVQAGRISEARLDDAVRRILRVKFKLGLMTEVPIQRGAPALLGAPDLTDTYWLYGNTPDVLREGLAKGRGGVMPAHAPLIGETRARLAAAYAWSLSKQHLAQ